MYPVCTAAAIRAAEQSWFDTHPGGDLFGPAVAAITQTAAAMLEDLPHGFVLVVAGRGNNGEDARRTGAELARRGVDVVDWDDEGASLAPNDQRWSHLVLVIDGFTGIGGRPGLPDDLRALAAHCRRRRVAVLAVDVPSGLVADSGELHGSFTADVTVTFIARKPVHVLQPAASRCGEVVLADIGVRVPERVMTAQQVDDVIAAWPWPGPTSDKYSRGVVGLDTGSSHYPGAGLLSTCGALHAGAGMVRHAGPPEVTDRVLTRWPSVVIGAGRVQAWVCGSGWGPDDGTHADRLRQRLDDGVPVVIDADALSVMPAELPAGCLLTPHAGELARLLDVQRDAVEAEPLAHARRAGDRWGATVLLKGATQLVVAPGGAPALVAVPGPAWTAQAGSGDTLAGACGTLLAAGRDASRAAVLAASLQAQTAANHPGPWTPDELADRFALTLGQWWASRR